jgi:hypothetical protein
VLHVVNVICLNPIVVAFSQRLEQMTKMPQNPPIAILGKVVRKIVEM